MIFKGIDNQTVELKITNYQYPEIIDGDWDSNWLNIYLNVKCNFGHWQTIDPSLTTWEVQNIINWFENISKNKLPEFTNLNFTEPNLTFELLESVDSRQKRFRIKFYLESRPKSAKADKEYFVDCLTDNNELNRIVIDLKIELNQFPERKPTHNTMLAFSGR